MVAVRRLFALPVPWCALLLALVLGGGLLFLFPEKSEAHAILLRSNPANDAILSRAPRRIQLWFSEELNTSLSTVAVVNEADGRSESGNAHVLTANPTEMDLNLTSTLNPSVYRVNYRSVANDDGRMVLSESMRLYPPAWAFGRQALAEDEIGGYRIAKGAFVLLFPAVTHRHPDFWEQPDTFDPERFAPERTNGRHRFAYIPFGEAHAGVSAINLPSPRPNSFWRRSCPAISSGTFPERAWSRSL